MIEKPAHIYKAIAESLKAFGDRHYINARSHMAEALGLRGKNAAIQLSNILNYKTYNPACPKALKIGQLAIILEELDQKDVAHIMNSICEPHGLICVKKEVSKTEDVSFHEAADNVMLESDDVFKTTKLALRDDTLTEDELEAIIKEINESDNANANLKRLAKERLKTMREEA